MATPTKSIVEKTLRDYPKTRSSDKDLFAHVAIEYGLVLTETQLNKLFNMPSLETITRVRRKIQEEGKYPADKAVRQHRKLRSLEVQQRIPKTSSEKVDALINEPPAKLSQTGLFSGFRRRRDLG